jgi:hypothetical protein
MSPTTKKYIKDLVERAAKTFAQTWVAVSLAAAGLADTAFEQPNEALFDALFSASTLKIAAVGAVLSVLTSFASKPVGPDNSSASLVVATDDPKTPLA